MERNAIRNSLSKRLDVADLKYDIRRLSAELYYHKSKTAIFEETVKAQRVDLDEILGTHQQPKSKEEIYR